MVQKWTDRGFSMVRNHSGLLRKIAQSEAGNVFPLTAAAIFVMAGLVGGGVDASRAYLVQNRLQNACDAGVLAGRKNVRSNGFDATALNAARSYFNVNMAGTKGVEIGTFTPTTPDNGNTIEANISTEVDTTLMRVFGYERIPVAVSCTASMSMGNADVMMVLDTTGSMNLRINGTNTNNDEQRRIHFLREAMKDFYASLSAAADGTNARIRYGFVPYSSSVNVGHLLEADWLVDSMNIHSREGVYEYETNRVVVGYKDPVYSTNSGNTDPELDPWSNYSSARYWSESDCNAAKPANQAWQNGSSDTDSDEFTNAAQQYITTVRTVQDQSRRTYRCAFSWFSGFRIQYRDEKQQVFTEQRWTRDPIFEEIVTREWRDWIYKRRTLDVSQYKLFEATTIDNGDSQFSDDGYENGLENGADIEYTWDGCIEERGTSSEASFSYSSLLGMSPYTWDLDIDSEPDGSYESKWRPMWSEMAFRRGTAGSIYNSNQSYEGYRTSAFCPSQAQLLARMSEEEFEDAADALAPAGSTYLDLGMLWGGRLLSPTGIFSDNVMEVPTNGAEVSRHLIFLTDGEMEPNPFIYSAYGTEYYDRRITENGITDQKARHTSRFRAVCQAVKAKGVRIWVIAFASELNADLLACASSESSFQAADSAQLNNAFQEIAKNVGELRITL